MAEKRMFTMKIVDSDAFKEMPLSAQALYFHLGMNADDEGFLNNAKSVQRSILASEDDMKLLIAKNFIIPFESGVVVIKHWKMHNQIQPSKLRATQYIEERKLLGVKENKAYTLLLEDCRTNADELPTKCRRIADESSPSIDKYSIEQYRVDKKSIDSESDDSTHTPKKLSKKSSKKPDKNIYGEYQNVELTDNEYMNLSTDYGEVLRDKAIKFLDEYIEEKSYKSKSHNLAIRRWVINAVNEQEAKNQRQINNIAYKKQNVADQLDESYNMMKEWAEGSE